MSLPNHYGRNMNPNADPRAPGSKVMRTNMGPYPGGVPYLTDKYINNDKQVNKTPGRKTNGSIRTTVMTRTRDQNTINVDQFAFMDTRKTDNPIMLNLQTMNWKLASDEGELGTILNATDPRQLQQYRVDGKGIDYNRYDAEKAYIMDNFKLYGVVVNRDASGNTTMAMERIARAFTCTVKNVCNVLDYFSYKGNVLKPYNSCFFVLKKVKVKADMKWENVLTVSSMQGSLKKANASMVGKMKWQIIPYHAQDNVLDPKYRMWEDDAGVTSVGGMWKLGKIHEYPDICVASVFEKRTDPTVVARDISLLHGRGRVTPVHFYLNMQEIY